MGRAGLDAVVARLPDGPTPSSATTGPDLSAGERQRVALARAFVRDSPLLLLDEPTANLDGRTEESVLAAVRRLMVGRTVVIVAHRPSLLALADRVVHLAPRGGGVLMRRRRSPERRARRMAPLGRTLAMARPAAGRLLLTALLGAGAIAADIGLLGTAAWLISKAAQHPNESQLAVAIVGCSSSASPAGFFRYGERLVGHDAAFRLLADLRVRVYQRLERLAPSGLPAFRRGDLLARIVQDVDSLQDLVIRVIPPFGTAVMVGSLTVALLWWMLPAAAVILAVALVWPGSSCPGSPGSWPGGGSRGSPGPGATWPRDGRPHRGRAELVAFGAMEAQLAADPANEDAELTAIAAASAGTAGIGLVPHHPAGRAGLLGLSPGRHPGGDQRTAERHRSGRDHPHPPGRLRAGRRAAGGHPGPPAGASGGGPGVRGDRRAGSRGRSRDADAAPRRSLRPGGPVGVGRLPGRRRPGAPGGGPLRSRRPAGGRGGAERCRQVDAGRRAPPVPALRRRFGPPERTSRRPPRRRRPSHRGGHGGPGRLPVRRHHRRQPAHRAPPVDRDELRDVLDRVGLAGWLDELPEGLATEVGRHGSHLSGGQRQRVAVARALLADFPVLVLDEPAEHLDPLAADALTADLLAVTDDRSLVLITHRLAGLESVDEILVMDEGRVVERGTHDVLIDRGRPVLPTCGGRR